ncbi:hypothetical protein [Cloacibacillus evryensis]|uniref:virion core protein, T7 gp14 family n=1 Tax=Cloacibacillus evryensis TaxID=508460 RepID=UPI00210CAAF5|nr:hypothetical protein [Cloacibacillus evryensis]MCQ4763490.1 hypothetical protein [Cloacibacillus evryensis]
MCTLAMAISGFGSAFSAMGAINQGKAAQAQADYSAAMARQNADMERRKSDDALERGRMESAAVREKGRQFAGAQRAALASSGAQLDTGSPLAMQVDTAGITAADAAKAGYNAAMESWGFLGNAAGYETRARNYEAEGAAAKKASYLSAGTSLLTGASSLASQWDFWKGGGTAGAGLSSMDQALMYPDFMTRKVYTNRP